MSTTTAAAETPATAARTLTTTTYSGSSSSNTVSIDNSKTPYCSGGGSSRSGNNRNGSNTALPSVACPPFSQVIIPMLTAAEAGVFRVARVESVLEAAVASGDQDTIKLTLDFYKRHVPEAFVWQRFLGHGLWGTYPRDVQDQAHAAVARGHATIAGPNGTQLHLYALQERMGTAERAIRCAVQTTFLCPDGAGWTVTSRAGVDPAEALVLIGSGMLAMAAPDQHTLQLLCNEAVVDPSIWSPPCKSAERRGSGPDRAEAYKSVSRAFFAQLFGAPSDLVSDLMSARPTVPEPELLGRGARGGAAESRFTDGLASPSNTTGASRFYPPDYESPVGTLDFCCALPDNALGLHYPMPVIVQMCVDAVSKMFELGRRGETLSPVHILPIYVYTCELAESDDQIYGAMNRAMRETDVEALVFWRPLIWMLDGALQVAPPPFPPRGLATRFPWVPLVPWLTRSGSRDRYPVHTDCTVSVL